MEDEVTKRTQFMTEESISGKESSMCKSKRHEIGEAYNQTAKSMQLCYSNSGY